MKTEERAQQYRLKNGTIPACDITVGNLGGMALPTRASGDMWLKQSKPVTITLEPLWTDELAQQFAESETAGLRALVGELATHVPGHEIHDFEHDPKKCLKCRAEEATK